MTTPTQPVVVGLFRAFILAGFACALAGVSALIAWLTPLNLGQLAWTAPIAIPGLRVLEAWLLDQQRGQADQDGLLGGAPADPGAYIDPLELGVDAMVIAKVADAIAPSSERLSIRSRAEVAAIAARVTADELTRRTAG